MRLLRRVLAMAILSIAVAGSAYAQALGQIHGKVTDNTAAVMPGVTVTVAGTGLQQPLVAVSSRRALAILVPGRADWHVFGDVRIERLQEGHPRGCHSDHRLRRDDRHEDGDRQGRKKRSPSSPSPRLVDTTKKTTTGGDFTVDQMLKVPTARDPWQVVNMAPSIVLSGVNVGGSASGQQLGISAFGSSDSASSGTSKGQHHGHGVELVADNYSPTSTRSRKFKS